MSELFKFHPDFHLSTIVRDVYIETGVGLGKSFRNALRSGFRTLYGIEIDEECYKDYSETILKHVPQDVKVNLYKGSSPDILDSIIDGNYPTTFWLDAHYTGSFDSYYDKKYGECPLLKELEVIVKKDWLRKPLILIDDSVCFTGSFWKRQSASQFHPEEWPTLEQILEILDPHEYTMILNMDILYFF